MGGAAAKSGGSVAAPPDAPPPDQAAVLVAHGSADRRAAAMTRALVRAVAAARPGLDVRSAYLDHAGPRPGEVLAAMAGIGHASAAVVPLLLTAAYHGRVDLPAVLAAARTDGLRLPVRTTDVLGPVGGVTPAPLVAALRRRLFEALPPAPSPRSRGYQHALTTEPRVSALDRRAAAGDAEIGFDAVVLAAAGTRDERARATVAQAATALGEALGVPCLPGYASATPSTAGEAVRRLRAAGARRVAAAAYFLATGQLYRTAMESARAAGVVAIAAPLADAPELARLVLSRVDAAATPTLADQGAMHTG
jgi:sirohydrochlorin ferrochelatase